LFQHLALPSTYISSGQPALDLDAPITGGHIKVCCDRQSDCFGKAEVVEVIPSGELLVRLQIAGMQMRGCAGGLSFYFDFNSSLHGNCNIFHPADARMQRVASCS